jgi:hypothetical protein
MDDSIDNIIQFSFGERLTALLSFFLRFVHDYHLHDVVGVAGVHCQIGRSTVLPFVGVFFSALTSA